MATFDLGRVTLLYKSDYSASTSYELNDVVLYNGSLYWHVQATATVGILPTDTTVWKLAFSDEGVRAEIRGYADNAQTSADSALASSSAAAASASNASASASQAALSAQTASTKASEASISAQTASTKASEASTSAQSAASSAQTATDKATLASQKAAAASESATLATAKANAAATSETNAAASAQTATAKASEAAASATSAQEYDESAQQSAVNAQTAQGLAETAQTAAETAQGLAEDARDLAQQYAENIDPEHIYSAFPTDTAEGSIASFADGADDIPLKSLVVNIDPVQDLSQGDPSPENICPISGWTGANVTRCGKNLLDPSLLKDQAAWNNIPVKVKPNTVYTMSTNKGTQADTGLALYFNNTNTQGGTDSTAVRSGHPITITSTSEGYVYVSQRVVSGEDSFQNYQCQIEEGSTVTDYEPYSGQTIPIDWQTEAGTVYGGSLDVLTGALTVDRAMVDLGTLTWNGPFPASGNNYFTATNDLGAKIPSNTTKKANAICSNYKVASQSAWADYIPCFFINTGGALVVADRSYSDVATFKSAMSGIQLVYELATPIEIQLTPHEVKSLLGQNSIFADTGDSSVEYRADTKLYIERLTEPDADMIADANIVSGQYFMVGNKLYKATANIASGSAVIVGTNAIRKSLSEALNEINQ